MVRAGAFKFELVEAETKIPFQEHAKAGKFYVEAEPGAEYFLSMQKVDKTETDVCVEYFVDEKKISSCCVQRGKKSIDKRPSYKGLRTVENGVSMHTALEFVKPKFSDSTSSSRGLMMGKVEIKISELQYTGRMKKRRSHKSSSFAAATVDVNGETTSKKKNLRSAEGTINTNNKTLSAMKSEIIVGKHLDTSKFGVLI